MSKTYRSKETQQWLIVRAATERVDAQRVKERGKSMDFSGTRNARSAKALEIAPFAMGRGEASVSCVSSFHSDRMSGRAETSGS